MSLQSDNTRQHRVGDIRHSVLPSGLRVVSEQMPGAASACVGFFVDVGSRQETLLQHGASHFLEHVLFKGTPTRDAEEISMQVERVGGDLNAYTAKEHTLFHARVPGSDGPMAVEVLADMLANSVVRATDFEAEREVILDEIAMHHDDPGEVAHDLVSARVLTGDPLERAVIGSERSILEMTRRRVINFWRRHYRPDNIVISAAGDVDHDQLVSQAESFAAQLPATSPVQPVLRTVRRHTPAVVEPGVITRSRDFEQSNAVMGFRGPGVKDEQRPALNLLVAILGGGMSSRLFVEVRERRGLAYAIDASAAAFSDTGLVSVEWANQSERTAEIVDVVRSVVADVCDGGISADELERAKSQLRGQMLLGYEGAMPRMIRQGNGVLNDDLQTIEDLVAAHDRVELDDLTAAAQTFLGPIPVVGIVGQRADRRRVDRVLRRWSN